MIYPLKEKEGMLRLYHRKESIAEAAYCSYFGLRQKSYRFEAETVGLVLYQNHENHLRMEIAKKQEQKKLAQQNAAQMAMKKIRTDRSFQQYIISLKKKVREDKKAREENEQKAEENTEVNNIVPETDKVEISTKQKEAMTERAS